MSWPLPNSSEWSEMGRGQNGCGCVKGRGLDSIPGERRLDTLEERRNREGKGMIDRSLLFSKTTFQKGRRREGVESSWCVNQRIATMMKTVLIVTVTGVYGDSQGSFPSLCSSAEPRATQGGLQGCYFTEGRHGLQRGGFLAQDYMSNYCQRWAGRRETSWLPATYGLPHMGSSCGQPERMGPLSELRIRHKPPAALA